MRAFIRTLQILTLPGVVAVAAFHGHLWSLTAAVNDLLLCALLCGVALGFGPLISQRLMANHLAELRSEHRDDIEQLRDELTDAIARAREEGVREGVMRERLATDRRPAPHRPNLSVAK